MSFLTTFVSRRGTQLSLYIKITLSFKLSSCRLTHVRIHALVRVCIYIYISIFNVLHNTEIYSGDIDNSACKVVRINIQAELIVSLNIRLWWSTCLSQYIEYILIIECYISDKIIDYNVCDVDSLRDLFSLFPIPIEVATWKKKKTNAVSFNFSLEIRAFDYENEESWRNEVEEKSWNFFARKRSAYIFSPERKSATP